MVMSFVSKTRKNRRMVGALLREGNLTFSVFCTQVGDVTGRAAELRLVDKQANQDLHLVTYFNSRIPHSDNSLEYKELFNQFHVEREFEPLVTDKYVNMSMLYLFRKATLEVRQFNSTNMVKKHMVEQDGILLSKNRMVAGLDYIHTGELNINLGSLGIKVHAPVLDRYSPLAYSVAQHVHWNLAPHRGMETHHRVSLEHVHILQGMSLFKELSQECIRCHMRRKRYLEAKMGGVKPEQLIVAPPFWTCQVDLFGPYRTFVPGYERETRNRQMLDCQVWVLAAVCPTTRLVNLQVVEKTNAGGIICGFTRLACEVGMPKYVFCDQDTAIMAALENAEVTIRDLQLPLHRG